MRKKSFGTKAAQWLLLFLLTAAVLSIALWRCGIFPFGSSSILLVDLGEQYTDFLVFFRNSTLPEKIYSFSKGFGGETLGLTAYYLMSPLNLLMYLFPASQAESAVVLIVYAKFLLIAGCAKFYFSRRGGAYSTTFALLYALCPFFVMYFFNVLWMDGFALLPLLAWGCECTVEKRDTRFFTAAYLCALLTNYYIAYMSSLFILLYLFFFCCAKLALPAKQLLDRTLRMARSVAAAACLSAPVTLPALAQLQKGKLDGAGVQWSAGRMFNPLLIPADLFSGTFLYETVPFLFFTAGSVLLFLAFFCTRAYPRRLKIGAALLWGFLAFSLYFRPLYLVWHGLQEPEGFYYRFYFVYFFFLLCICRAGLAGMAELAYQRYAVLAAVAVAGGFGLYFFTRATLPWGSHTVLRTVALLLAFGCGVTAAVKGKKYAKPALACLLAASVMLDSVSLFRQYYATSASAGAARNYAQNYTEKQALLAQEETTQAFYRTEDISQRPGNQPMALGYCGTTHYSSTFDALQKEIYLHYLGKESFLGTYYNESQLLVDSFWGIRWLMAGENIRVDPACRRAAAQGGSVLYENPYAFPVMFAMPQAEISPAAEGTAEIRQLCTVLAGGEAGAADADLLARAAQTAQAGAAQLVRRDGGSLTATVQAGENEMLAMTIPADDAWHITVDGRRVHQESFMTGFLCVPLEAGTHTIRMVYIPAGLPAGILLFAGCVLCLVYAGLKNKKRAQSPEGDERRK